MKFLAIVLMVFAFGFTAEAQVLKEVSKIDKVEVLEQGIVQIRLVKQILKDGAVIGAPWYHRYSCDKDYAKTDLPAEIKAICKSMLDNLELKKQVFVK